MKKPNKDNTDNNERRGRETQSKNSSKQDIWKLPLFRRLQIASSCRASYKEKQSLALTSIIAGYPAQCQVATPHPSKTSHDKLNQSIDGPTDISSLSCAPHLRTCEIISFHAASTVD